MEEERRQISRDAPIGRLHHRHRRKKTAHARFNVTAWTLSHARRDAMHRVSTATRQKPVQKGSETPVTPCKLSPATVGKPFALCKSSPATVGTSFAICKSSPATVGTTFAVCKSFPATVGTTFAICKRSADTVCTHVETRFIASLQHPKINHNFKTE
ncbi:MAG: hypothetical protein LBC47_06605 [Tannerella sp.]|jgi:hypothetical protein|nr:hypothetical protein [Tannerella sp.]